jgi:cytochrome d ubiquinol oxidase subunit I
VLPTFLGASSLTIGQIWITIAGFTLLYSVLAVIEVRLMLTTIRKGPEDYTPWQPRRDPVPPAGTPNPFHSVPAE